MCIGYALDGQKLEPIIFKATDKKPTVDRIGGGVLKGAWEGAVLSEPVTITIGPDKEKK